MKSDQSLVISLVRVLYKNKVSSVLVGVGPATVQEPLFTL